MIENTKVISPLFKAEKERKQMTIKRKQIPSFARHNEFNQSRFLFFTIHAMQTTLYECH
ncbi:Uncharacterized protein APZ42_023380 [Daphnia magna]|uniref:Uncharacterized protein n=1 Tax=Daphnia magna TaxID=35525 RepID=A0A0P5ZCR3_9CRUS|nr:Uncharacterized protein APZ42_023380 [Daphnia magna]